MPVTRTLNPLPFTDLEPRRFEDLVRQLVYDFRPWLRLEATGRAGSDDGFDVRAIEAERDANNTPNADEDDDFGEGTEPRLPIAERIWLVQCKREKAIGPTKLRKYLNAIDALERKMLYGIIFVAACDFSKSSRDIVANWSRDNGLSEFQVWSVSDIETMLLQPRNDRLLFAFFGISLQLRKRSTSVAIRSRLATKQKISRLLNKHSYAPFLLRDPSTESFPYVTKGETPNWMIRSNRGMDFRGLGFHYKEYFAFIREDGCWDVANKCNQAVVEHDNPWADVELRQLTAQDKAELMTFVGAIPLPQQARLNVTVYVPFEDIVAVDEIGDECWGDCRGMPVIYVPIAKGQMSVHPDVDVSLQGGGRSDPIAPDPAKRIVFFPAKFRSDEEN